MTASEIAETYTWNIVVNRWLATWIDLILLILFLLGPSVALGDEFYRNTSGIWIALVCLYYPVCEGYNGTTVGKLIAGIRVVDNDLNPPGIQKALIRTALRLVEVNPVLLGGIPAALFVLNSKHKQRLGDRLADTFVLRVKDIEKAMMDQSQTNE